VGSENLATTELAVHSLPPRKTKRSPDTFFSEVKPGPNTIDFDLTSVKK
jgi:hypothetical protein